MQVVYLTTPTIGGVFSVYNGLRSALAVYGHRVTWLGSGSEAWNHCDGNASTGNGEVVAGNTEDPRIRSEALLSYLRSAEPDVVIINVLSGLVEMNIARYLPESISRIALVHSISPTTYRAARAICPHVDLLAGVSPRIVSDLVQRGCDPHRTRLIPNAIDGTRFCCRRPRVRGSALRLLLLGRLEDASKGINWVPDILRCVARRTQQFHLTVAGGGPDLEGFESKLFRYGVRHHVSFIGFVNQAEIAKLITGHDVLLMPSRFEGFPMAMLEAMAGGCVPVASRIRGVTDYLVTHGESGLLFPVGDTKEAAAAIMRLASDASMWGKYSNAAAAAARRFDWQTRAKDVDALLASIREQQRPLATPMHEWELDPRLSNGWWHWLPASVKNRLRVVRERIVNR